MLTVIGVPDRADRADGADLGQPLGEPHGSELRPRIGVCDQPDEALGAAGGAGISSASRTISVFMCAATRQPTMRRLNASTMKHT
jgi:hypothetical protein